MEWLPIASYDKLKKVYGTYVFLFEEQTGRNALPRTIQFSRHYGHRTCIAYCQIPKKEDFPCQNIES